MRVIGSHEQQAIDRFWVDRTGLPLLLLMEQAATAVVDHCLALFARADADQKNVLLLCGPGQNGGDAYACARLFLAAGWSVACREFDPQRPRPPEAAANRQALLGLGLQLADVDEQAFKQLGKGLVIDGLFGAGFDPDRPADGRLALISRWIQQARQAGSQVVAIDVPSGVDADSGRASSWAFTVDHTVTFVGPKLGLCTGAGRLAAGSVHIAPIGISPAWVDQALAGQPAFDLLTRARIARFRPARPPDAHKGLLGRVLLIAGSRGMPGAAVLAAEAAARSGAGLVQLLVPQPLLSLAAVACPEALIQDRDQLTDHALFSLIAASDVVAVGPGLGDMAGLDGLLETLLRKARKLVVDADALNAMARQPKHYQALLRERGGQPNREAVVLTPHPGEAKRLAPDLTFEDRRHDAWQLARRWQAVVVLKGHGTVLLEPDGSGAVSLTGHDGLARGGSGDVLTGLMAGLMAQHLAPFEAAASAVWLHGLAGQLAADQRDRRSALPRDLIDQLPMAWREAGW